MTERGTSWLGVFVSGRGVAGQKGAGVFLNSCFRSDRKMRTTEMSQAIGVRPRANIHKAVNPAVCFVPLRIGCQTRSSRNPSASTETRRNLTDFLTVAEACRNGPRRMPNNSNPANHSTGVFRNHS